jgi:hypothetical protein
MMMMGSQMLGNDMHECAAINKIWNQMFWGPDDKTCLAEVKATTIVAQSDIVLFAILDTVLLSFLFRKHISVPRGAHGCNFGTLEFLRFSCHR